MSVRVSEQVSRETKLSQRMVEATLLDDSQGIRLLFQIIGTGQVTTVSVSSLDTVDDLIEVLRAARSVFAEAKQARDDEIEARG